jgi:hypothetical protein
VARRNAISVFAGERYSRYASGESNVMRNIYRALLIAALAAVGTQASAQSRSDSHYEMVTTQLDQNVSFGASTGRRQGWRTVTDKVVILDKRTGEIWAWSEPLQTVMFLGQIFPLSGTGVIAHIIQVPENTR